MKFREKYDRPWFGLVTAAVLPILGFFMSYGVKYYPYPIKAYWREFMYNTSEQTGIFTLSMIPSLLSFYFILFQWKMERASKTFVGISLIYVTIFMYLNFLS
ncbi:MAG TPA: hypothetical protein VK177_18730 [Flavobacteriales bacterium]|nr:hypothetical protein [Flavobacteriales bacterium]